MTFVWYHIPSFYPFGNPLKREIVHFDDLYKRKESGSKLRGYYNLNGQDNVNKDLLEVTTVDTTLTELYRLFVNVT